MINAITFDDVADYVIGRSDRARADLARYFGAFSVTSSGHTGYTGRFFEHYAQRSDPAHFNGNDIAAASALSVQFDPITVAAIAHDAQHLDDLLAQCPPPKVPIWDVEDAVINDEAPLAQLYERLKGVPGVGYVKASKLLAAKRPHLVPIRDRRVEQLLGNPDQWWAPWQKVMKKEAFRSLLAELADGVAPPDASLLRVLDVILWCDATRQDTGAD